MLTSKQSWLNLRVPTNLNPDSIQDWAIRHTESIVICHPVLNGIDSFFEFPSTKVHVEIQDFISWSFLILFSRFLLSIASFPGLAEVVVEFSRSKRESILSRNSAVRRAFGLINPASTYVLIPETIMEIDSIRVTK